MKPPVQVIEQDEARTARSVKGSQQAKDQEEAKAQESKDGKHDEAEEEEQVPVEVGHAMPMEEFLVNLTGNGDHYLRTTIALGLRKGLTEEKAKEHVAAMRDAILTVLSEKTLKDLSNTKGRDKLKEQLIEKVNEAVGGEELAGAVIGPFALGLAQPARPDAARGETRAQRDSTIINVT
jgi:flagellar FliL protein